MGRSSRTWSIQALQSRTTGGTVPETASEMKGSAAKAKSGVIVAADASHGIASAMMKAKVVSPKGAVHYKHEYCAVRIFSKSELDEDVTKTLKDLCKKQKQTWSSTLQRNGPIVQSGHRKQFGRKCEPPRQGKASKGKPVRTSL